ncbi:hypothetical protein [Dyadobacter sp. CY323]|uniref:hypothetical protein n=1 Tax=Dyadobacter sp. CY323 TaxID=2907302 RepID=UPI001F415009|nr:hypothetical protein [Dyadobacter sp. CY323]MCE6992524.1 hypothetical protein [Dyadobacter sp. CY323]
MKYFIRIAVSLLLFSTAAHAQIINISFSVATQRPLSRLDELQSLAESGGMVMTLTNLTNQQQTIQLEVLMSSPQTDFKIQTNPDARSAALYTLSPNQVKTFTPTELSEDLFYDDSFVLGNGQLLTDFLIQDPTGQIPTGQYQLCVRVRPDALNQQLSNTLSNVGCANLIFQQFAAPLINTINGMPCPDGGGIPAPPAAAAPFSIAFTPLVFQMNNVTVTDFSYTVFILELLPGDSRDPNQIFQALQVGIESRNWVVRKTIHPPGGAPQMIENLMPEDFSAEMKIGSQYAIAVQGESASFSSDQLPNRGLSPVCIFTYGSDAAVRDNFASNDSDPNLLPECVNGDCNNIPIPEGGTDVTELPVDSDVYVGCFKVRVREAARSGEGFNGRGVVRIPVFSALFLVELKGLVVKKFGNKLAAVAGSVEGLPDEALLESGPIYALYDAFQTAKATATEATSSLPAVVSNAVGGKVESAARPIDAAFKEIRYIDRAIQQLANEDFESGLPIGYASELDGEPLRVGIFGLTFTPQRATMQVILQTPTIPGINQPLYFGAMNVCFSQRGIFATQSTFYLGGDLDVSIGGHTLRLKGSGSDSPGDQVTYITLDNGDFKEVKLQGEMLFDRSLFVPKTGTDTVKATFESIARSNFDDLTFDLKFPQPFGLKAHPGWNFTLEKASLDLSTVRNPGSWSTVPEDIRNTVGSDEATQNTWTGVFVEKASIGFPKDFKLGNSGQSPSADLKFLMISFEGSGVSFDAEGHELLTLAGPKKGALAGFGLSIDQFDAKMRGSEFTALTMDGKLRFELFDITGTNEGAFPYHLDFMEMMREAEQADGTEEPELAFEITLSKDIKLEVEQLHAAFSLTEGSNLTFNSNGHDDDPDKKIQFNLQGEVSLISGEDGIDLPGLKFTNFFFNGATIDWEDFNVSFASPQKWIGGGVSNQANEVQAGGFPISLEEFKPIFSTKSDGYELGFGFEIVLNLKEGAGFGLTTGISLTTQLTSSFAPKPNSFAFTFEKIKLETDVSIMSVKGELDFIKNDPVFGNGFYGCLVVKSNLPGLPIEGRIQGKFGSVNQFRYFYIEGLLTGLNLIIPQTPMAVDGFAGGLYYNMTKDSNSPSFAARLNTPVEGCAAPALLPKKDGVGISFGILFKEVASQGFSFNGIMTMEAEMDAARFSPKFFKVGGAARFLKVPGPVPEGSVTALRDAIKIAADLSLTYDFVNNIFSGDFNLYFNIANVVKGDEEPETARAGRMVMYFGQDDWFVYLGNPWEHRDSPGNMLQGMGRYAKMSITVPDQDLAQIKLKAGVYFCMGTYGIERLPRLPDESDLSIPQDIRNAVLADRPPFDSRASSGGGVAFGGFVGGDIGIDFELVKAGVKLGFGMDLALIKYNDGVRCSGYSGPIGIDGAYATGQVYGYVMGEIKVDIPGDEDLLLTSVDARLIASFGGPNPTWVTGEANISKETLVNLVDIAANQLSGGISSVVNALAEGWDSFWGDDEVTNVTEDLVEDFAPNGLNIPVVFGDKCSPSAAVSFNDKLGAQSIIVGVQPEEKLEPYGTIKVRLNKNLSQPWDVVKDEGNNRYTTYTRNWYLKSVKLWRPAARITENEVPLQDVTISDNELLFRPSYRQGARTINAGEQVTFTVELGIEERIGNGSKSIKRTFNDGTPAIDKRVVSLTGAAISYEIGNEDIVTSYPVQQQSYYLQGHTQWPSGFIKLRSHFPEFLPAASSDIRLRFFVKTFANRDSLGVAPCSYRKYPDGSAGLTFGMLPLPNDARIEMEFWVEKTVVSTQAVILSKCYSLTFGTSRYNTFAEKMSETRATRFNHDSPQSAIMEAILRQSESWDDLEISGNKPLIVATTKLNTAWHAAVKQKFESYLASGFNSGQTLRERQAQQKLRANISRLIEKLDPAVGNPISTGLAESNSFSLRYLFNDALIQILNSIATGGEVIANPTAGDYAFHLSYQFPQVSEHGVVSYAQSGPASQPGAGRTGSGQTAVPVQTGIVQSGASAPAVQVAGAVNTLNLRGVTFETSVHYPGMSGAMQQQQQVQSEYVNAVERNSAAPSINLNNIR